MWRHSETHCDVIARLLLGVGRVHADGVVDDHGLRLHEEGAQQRGYFPELDTLPAEYLGEVHVAVDVLPLVRVLSQMFELFIRKVALVARKHF